MSVAEAIFQAGMKSKLLKRTCCMHTQIQTMHAPLVTLPLLCVDLLMSIMRLHLVKIGVLPASQA